jgi:thiol-disulfide isomerase/thioredoxin
VSHPSSRPLSLGLAALLALSATARAAGEDAEARKLLDAVVAKYKGLDAYADSGRFGIKASVNGQAKTQSETMSLAFARPNKLDLDTGTVRLTSDGKTMTTTIVPSKRFVQGPAPARLTSATIREGSTGAMIYGNPTAGLTVGVMLALLAGDDPAKEILDGAEGLTLEADRKADGKTLKALRIDRAQGPGSRILVDADSKLVAGIELVVDPKELAAGVPKGTSFSVDRIGWDAGAVKAGAEGKADFTFKAPSGFTKVETLAAAFGPPAGAGGDDEEPAQKLVGQAAPDFTLIALDGAKARPLTKADLAGKVVVIDFWATWCPPCLKELPEVQKMVQALAKGKKDVRVIALSVDENPAEKPGDYAPMRKLVEDKLREIKVDLSGNAVGLVALDADGRVAAAYQANAIPMIVLLDRKGVVQAVHIGYTERDVLEEEINTLLDGKSLAKPKGEAKPKD